MELEAGRLQQQLQEQDEKLRQFKEAIAKGKELQEEEFLAPKSCNQGIFQNPTSLKLDKAQSLEKQDSFDLEFAPSKGGSKPQYGRPRGGSMDLRPSVK